MLVLFGKFNKSFPLLCPRDSCDTTFTVHRPIGFYGNKHFWICKCFAVLPNQLVVKQLLAFIVMLWRGVPHYLAVLFQCVQAAQKVFLHSVWRDKCLFFFLKTQLYSLQALINSELSNCQWWKQRLYPWTFDLTIPVIFLRLLRFNYSSQITLKFQQVSNSYVAGLKSFPALLEKRICARRDVIELLRNSCTTSEQFTRNGSTTHS